MTLNIFNARTFLPPTGIAASAKCAIVGDIPVYHEIKSGKVFDGATGSVLQSCLAAANLIRSECYITNVIKDIDKPIYKRYAPKTKTFYEEGQQYIKLLKEELSQVESNFIIAAGEVALNALCSREVIERWRGSVIESTLIPGKWVIPILHPNTVPPPKHQTLNKYLIQFDLQRAAKWIELGRYEIPNYEVKLRPSFNESMCYLEKLLTGNSLVAFDIEVTNEEVSCISFSHNDRYAMSIAFIDSRGDIFTIDQELAIWLKIAEILESRRIQKLGQNLTFDAHFLLNKYGIACHSMHDTMIAQQIISPDFKKGLDFIVSIHTDMPYHKDEGKKWFKVGGSWQQFWNYNALDSLVCSMAFQSQLQDLHNSDNMTTYDRQRAIIEPLVYMQEHGIKADIEGIKDKYIDMMKEVDVLRLKLNELAGQELNANSPQQLVKYFYTVRRYKAYRSKGKVSVDDIAMKRLIRRGCAEAKVVLQIRKLRKLASTYLDLNKFDADGRIRCSYNPVGTRYSRLSSKENIFGTGMNMQNWPHSLLYYLQVDPHYVGYALDLSQAENRIVAYVGNIAEMIYAFDQKMDVHSLTAGLIFELEAALIKQWANIKKKCKELGDGTHTHRDWGKKANHGLNYDFGFKGFALKYEMPERDAKFIVDKYHAKYPGVREGFHKHVRKQLQKNRTVVNLYGRKTLFLGPMDQQTYKEAYACIPQGTVGDIINERGLSYVYNNQDLFEPVELLNQVHDEIVFQIPSPSHPTNPVSWEQHAQMIKLIKQSLEVELSFQGRKWTVPVDTTIFTRMKNGKDLGSEEIDQDIDTVANLIANTYGTVHMDTLLKEYQPELPK